MTKKKINKFWDSKVLWIIVSVLLAFFLWIYVNNNEVTEYSQTFNNIQVIFNGEEAMREAKGLIVTDLSSNMVSVTLKGTRREISKLRSGDIQAVVDLSTISRPGTNSNYYYTVSFVSGVDSGSISVQSQSPKTISFTVDRFSSKNVEIKGIFNGTVADGYKAEVSNMVFEPSTIRISGPEEDISAVDHAEVVIEREDLDSTIKVDMNYSLVGIDGESIAIGSMTADSDVVHVTFPVLMVKTVPLTLDIIHGAGTTDSNVRMECDPSEIMISGDADTLKGINRISLGSLDLTEFVSTYEKNYPVTLPNDVVNESGITEARVSIKLIGLASKRLSVTNIVTTNVPEGYTAEVSTQSIDVTIRAPEGVIWEIANSNLRAVLDMKDYSDNEGTFTVPASIKVDGFADAGVVYTQDYSALVQIKKAK